MKKIIYILLCLVLVFTSLALVACKDDGEDSNDDVNYLHVDKNGDLICDDCEETLLSTDNAADDEETFVPREGKCYAVITVKNFGEIAIELLPEYAKITVEHFIGVVDAGFYPGTTFHRILSNFMIQGGAPQSSSPSVDKVVGEFASNGYTYNTLSHDRGVISLARTNVKNSATSQFFICNADYPSLDGEYAAFGRVVVGMNVVDAITTYGMQYTSYYQNGMIDDTSKQPVIERIIIIDNR